jgi:Site-specific recombinase XerD
MLFCDVAQNYLEQDKENLAPLTVRTYYWNLKKIRDYDPTLDCSDVNEQMVRNYRRHLQQKGNKPNTIIKALSVLRNFSKKMLIDGLITENPFSRIRIGQVYTPRSYLTTSELK